jgi:hypothetical protein
MTDLTQLPWVSQPDGNVYAVTPDGNRNVGVMVSAEAADEAANSHNAALAARRLEDRARRSGVTRMTGLTGVQIGDGGTQNNVF